MDYSFENLSVNVESDGLAMVTVERPKVLNALNDATIAEIDRCFQRLGEDDAVRGVILTGAGEKAFVAGADIKELASQSVAEARARSRIGQRAFARIENLGKPVVAAIQGFALGGGCELALACHLRYASETARLGLPEVSLAIIPGYGGTQRLQRIVGRGRALELILTGDFVDAATAHQMGLVNGVQPADQLLDHARKVLTTILSRGPIAVEFALEAVLRGGDTTQEEGLQLEADLFGVISSTADMREGMTAFLEKRKPDFKGH